MEKILFISSSTQDKRTWAITIIIGILPVLFFGWKMLTNPVGFNQWTIPFILFLLLCIIGFAATPYKYILGDTELVIKRYWRDIHLPLSDIQSVQLISPSEKKTIWRSFGYSGPFGYFGFFTSSSYGKLKVFARRYDNWTLIATNRKKYVIAPNDLQLIDVIGKQIGQAEANMQTPDIPAKSWHRLITVIIIAVVALILYLGYREPTVEFNSSAFKLKGMYGVNIPFAEIAEVDTINWQEMPAISIRTNGISLFQVNRGRFRTVDGDYVRLSVYSGVSPVIRIVDRNNIVYYVNRKNPVETRQIFNQLSKSKIIIQKTDSNESKMDN